MNVWEMAVQLRGLAGENAKPNQGRKSKEYTELRLELINCLGPKRARALINEVFECYPHVES